MARSVPAMGQFTAAKNLFPCFGRGTYGPRMNNCAFFFSFSFVLLIIWERGNLTKLDLLHITFVAVGIYTLRSSHQPKVKVNPSTSSSPLMLHSFFRNPHTEGIQSLYLHLHKPGADILISSPKYHIHSLNLIHIPEDESQLYMGTTFCPVLLQYPSSIWSSSITS